MIAFPGKQKTQQKFPYDTGCTFKGVRVRLECDSPATAAQLGKRLASKGLPYRTPSRMMHTIQGTRVTFGRDRATGRIVHCCWPTQASANVVVLETDDSMLNQPFLRWLREKFPPPADKKPESMSLNELADAGEIEVIDCG